MSQVSMESMVNIIRSFEALGDHAVVESFGKMDGRDVAQVQTDQSRATQSFIRSIVSEVRNTQGMGESQATMAEKAFGELASRGTPIKGREVAGVLTTIVYSLQLELDPEAGLQELEAFARTMQSAPLHTLNEESFSADLTRVSHAQVETFVAANTTVEVDPASQAASQTISTVDAAIDDLQQFKDAMGGAPHYPSGRPCYEAQSKKFFGIPLEACQAWCQKQIDNATVGKSFWKFVGRQFGVSSSPVTTYERVSLYLDSMKRLAENRDQIVSALKENPSRGAALLSSTTRLAAHVTMNGADATIATIDSALGMFATLYEQARQNGTLLDFFENALKGVCFEDRTRNLQEYAFLHLSADSGDIAPSAPGVLYISPINSPEHNADNDISYVLSREIMAIKNSNPDKDFSWEEFKQHFMACMSGQTFIGFDPASGVPTGEPAVISEETVESLHEYFRDMLCIVDD